MTSVTSDAGLFANTACLWEVNARKAGDANPLHDLETLRHLDFLASGLAVAPILDDAPRKRIGKTVWEAVRAMRRAVVGNPHLGTILLLAPLAAVSLSEELQPGIEARLADLDIEDSRAVYQAIRLAQPSGLGSTPEQDIAGEPSLALRQIMSLAADRDLIARQYTNGFADVFDLGVPALKQGIERFACLEGAILFCQLMWLAGHPDSLIARKLGPAEAAEASRRAREVLDRRWPDAEAGWDAWKQLDSWMRSGRGRNPGTTADLVCASLFVALRTGILTLPSALPWTCPGWDQWLNASRST